MTSNNFVLLKRTKFYSIIMGNTGSCHNPDCFPYCGGCSEITQSLGAGVLTMLVIIFCLLAILLIFWLLYGPTLIHVKS